MGDFVHGLIVDGPPLWRAVFWAGVVLYLAGAIWMLVRAFSEGIGWGLAVLLIPVAALAFAVAHWDKGRGPLGAMVVATALVLVPQRFAESGRESGPRSDEIKKTGGYEVYGENPGPVYKYTDDLGRVQMVDDLSKVPAKHRAKAERIR